MTTSVPVPPFALAILVAISSCMMPKSAVSEMSEEVVERLKSTVAIVDSGTTQGTAFLISSEGLLLTNAHVIEDMERITVSFSDGRRYPADFKGFDRNGHDIAALKINAPEPLQYLRVGAGNEIRVGRQVFAVGNPFPTFPATITHGIISNYDRRYDVVLSDAALASGSSGGPLVSAEGSVLGMSTSLMMDFDTSAYSSGINTSLGVDTLSAFIADLANEDVIFVQQYTPEFYTLPFTHLELPARTDGELTTESDRKVGDRSFCRGYTIDLTAGTQVVIELESDEFDAYLFLYDRIGVISENDDADEHTTNARIIHQVTESGRYTIFVNTFEPGETGRYLLTVDEHHVSDEVSIEASLQGTDDEFDEISWDYQISGRSGKTISILMESDEVDSYLILLDGDGNEVARNDDYGDDTLDALILHTFDDDGGYSIRCTSFGRFETGAFTLTISWFED